MGHPSGVLRIAIDVEKLHTLDLVAELTQKAKSLIMPGQRDLMQKVGILRL